MNEHNRKFFFYIRRGVKKVPEVEQWFLLELFGLFEEDFLGQRCKLHDHGRRILGFQVPGFDELVVAVSVLPLV